MSSNQDAVTLEIEGFVARVILDREAQHNAFDDVMIARLTEIFLQLSVAEKVGVVILEARGKSFSAGADLAWMKKMAGYSQEENFRDAHALAAMVHALFALPQLTVAKVHGAAYGGALGLVAACDMALALDRARFCLSEVKLGLIPAVISPYVIRAIGERNASRYMQTAEVFSSERAQQMGLVSEIYESSNALDEALEQLLIHIQSHGPRAMRESKRLVLDIAGREFNHDLLSVTSEYIAAVRVSPEGQEGLSAFLEKRSPQWPK